MLQTFGLADRARPAFETLTKRRGASLPEPLVCAQLLQCVLGGRSWALDPMATLPAAKDAVVPRRCHRIARNLRVYALVLNCSVFPLASSWRITKSDAASCWRSLPYGGAAACWLPVPFGESPQRLSWTLGPRIQVVVGFCPCVLFSLSLAPTLSTCQDKAAQSYLLRRSRRVGRSGERLLPTWPGLVPNHSSGLDAASLLVMRRSALLEHNAGADRRGSARLQLPHPWLRRRVIERAVASARVRSSSAAAACLQRLQASAGRDIQE